MNDAIDKRAAEIARRLFTDGQGKVADRLVHVDEDNRQGGGWCEGAARDQIADVLRKPLRSITHAEFLELKGLESLRSSLCEQLEEMRLMVCRTIGEDPEEKMGHAGDFIWSGRGYTVEDLLRKTKLEVQSPAEVC